MKFISSLFIVLFLSSQLFASVTVFTSRASWESALGLPNGSSAGNAIGFELDSPMVLAPGTTSFTDLDVTIDANPNSLNTIHCCETDPGSTIQGHRFDGFLAHDTAFGATNIEFDFRTPVDAFGADYDQVNNHGIGMIVNGVLVDFRDHFGSAATMQDEGFLGVINTQGSFNSVDFVMTAPDIPGMNAEYWQVDNLSVVAIPEPSTGSLLPITAMCIYGCRRTRRRR